LQSVHLAGLSRRKNAETRLNSENIAPKGHKILHHGLAVKKIAIRNNTKTVSLIALGQTTF